MDIHLFSEANLARTRLFKYLFSSLGIRRFKQISASCPCERGHNGPLRDKLRSFLQQMKGQGEFTTMAKMLENHE